MSEPNSIPSDPAKCCNAALTAGIEAMPCVQARGGGAR
jgi:hypothetical protein